MSDDIERAARAICQEECAQCGDPPCWRFDDNLCDECVRSAKAVRDAHRDAGKVLVDAAMLDGLREEIRLLSEQLSAANEALLARDLPK